MNRVLDFGNLKVQYWIEEFPLLSKVRTLTTHQIIDGIQGKNLINTNKICVEMYLHKNASNYGLLGFEFKPKKNIDGLDIEIKYTDGNTERYLSEINKYDQTIYCGLTEEFIPYIKSRIMNKIQKLNYFYNGSIIVSCAANSEVGSSPRIFEIICDVIIEIFIKIEEKEVLELNEYFKSALYSCGLITGEY